MQDNKPLTAAGTSVCWLQVGDSMLPYFVYHMCQHHRHKGAPCQILMSTERKKRALYNLLFGFGENFPVTSFGYIGL